MEKEQEYQRFLEDENVDDKRNQSQLEQVEHVERQQASDLEQTDFHGKTRLMNSVENAEFCRCLLDMGASVNAIDPYGRTSLHHAISKNRVDIARLLLDYGADPTLTTTEGDDALRHAAIHGNEQTVEYLIRRLKPTPQKQADAYALLGAYYGDYQLNTEQAVFFWIKSLKIQVDQPMREVAPNSAYNYRKEIRDTESLTVIANDEDAVLMQSLLIRERILGRQHTYTWLGIDRCCEYYYNQDEYWPYFQLRKYEITHSLPTGWNEKFRSLTSLICMMLVEYPAGIKLNDVKETMNMAFDNLHNTSDETTFIQFIYLLHVSCRLAKIDHEKIEVMGLASELIQKDYNTDDGRTILHDAADTYPLFDDTDTNPYYDLPSVDAVEILLEAGANVGARDSQGKTALDVAVSSRKCLLRSGRRHNYAFRLKSSQIIDHLLLYDSHVDSVNGGKSETTSS